ncbi:MAG TPA: DNA polymerase III subunit delta, partial [Bacteroidales bacterium]|nr:DNA polymerase III subunit delta [Bacteroidales bacterium]
MLAIFGSMQFKEIPGQHEIKARLIQSVKTNRVSHALLLSGTVGSGNYALALAFAQYLQCQNPSDGDSCGVCPSCHQSAGLVHPDIHFVFPVARTTSNPGEPASDDLIEEWRKFIIADPFPVLEEWYG